MATDPTNPSVPLDQYTANQITNPTLSAGSTMTAATLPTDTATLQNTGQLMSTSDTGVLLGAQTNVKAPTTQPTATPITASQGTASTVDPNAITPIDQSKSSYTAANAGIAQGTAAQGQVNPLDTIQGQLSQLYSQTGIGQVPTWAAGAVAQAKGILANNGMAGSSIGAAAIVAAVQSSALPIAAADASTYFQMDMQNLSNQQQMAMQNIQNQQQALLSDQAATNAALQFNASNYTQVQEYTNTLVSNIMTQNADRAQAMSQFNAGQSQTAATQNVANQINVGEFTSQQQAAIDQFNSSQQFARDQFNSQAAYAIDQSNVTWRRNINTQNTAAINAANQVNVQNTFNMSQTAQNQLWQEWNDNASFQFTANENALTRQFNQAMAANNQSFANPTTGFNYAQAVGGFASALL